MTNSLGTARKRGMVQILIALLFFLFPHFATSTMMIEPQIAYKAGMLEEPAGAKSSLNGASFGGKLGWVLDSNLSFGFDGNYSSLEKEYASDPRVLYSANGKQLGLFLTADFSAFQATSCYFFVDELKFTNRDEELKGNALKLGLSIPVIASLNANFDYIKHNFRDAVGLMAKLPNDASTVMISVSYFLTR
ncbi:MAG: hypothetical protein A4S09_11375 [Proteobacteria bacterium SG_bin7]|nr:MAG: hypothetical protein A4S09_11375 [Proteobacteria bacterium SG_bin7]